MYEILVDSDTELCAISENYQNQLMSNNPRVPKIPPKDVKYP